MRILIRTSKWASWARRLGSLSLPLAVIPVLLHREGMVGSDAFVIVALAAAGVAALALVVSVVALGRLWHTGDRGWGRAFTGLVLSILCLLPVAWFGLQMLRYPQVTDIATANRSDMPLIFDADTTTMRPPKLLRLAQIEASFPNVKTRTYPLDAMQTYELVLGMVEAYGWQLRMAEPPPDPMSEGRINARTATLMGWREEIVLHVAGNPDGASVDMRSASLAADYDFGSNGQRIEGFLVDLDNAVTVLLRDNPNIDQPLDEETVEGAVAGDED